MSGSPPVARERRSDARGNRERIVVAARAALAQPGVDTGSVNLRLIARAAGVGQGTLYRHFPSREHLIAEVYRDEMRQLTEAAAQLLRTHEPLAALALWLDRVVEYARVKRGVVAAVEASAWQRLYAAEHPRLDAALHALIEHGTRSGRLRPDVDVAEVIALLGALSRIPADDWDRRARTVVAVIVDGLARR